MKTKIKSISIIVFLSFILFSILTNSKDTIDTVLFGINIWVYNVFPSLFPFFIISDLLLNYGFIEFLSEMFKNFMHLFHLRGSATFPFLGSMISGVPSGAKYTKEMLDQKLITTAEANHLIRFCHFTNPLFVIGTIGTILLNNKQLGFLLLFSHLSSGILTGLFFRSPHKSSHEPVSLPKAINNMHERRIHNQKTFSEILSESINNTMNILMLLLGIIIIFLVLTNIITKVFQLNCLTTIIIKGLLEMTQGVKYAAASPLPLVIKLSLISVFLSFGGLSVHMQVMTIINNTTIKYKNFFEARLVHTLLSVIITYLLYQII